MTEATSTEAQLAELMTRTHESLCVLKNTDGWLEVTTKICRKKKIELPASITSFSPACVACCSFWCYLLAKEKAQALANIQMYLRALAGGERQHLVEELCALALTISNVLVMAEACPVPEGGDILLTPKLIAETLEPMLGVIEGKIIYIKGKNAGATISSIKQVEAAVRIGYAPEDKKFSTQTPANEKRFSRRFNQRHGFHDNRKRYRSQSR